MAERTSQLRPKVYLPPGSASGQQKHVSLVLFSHLQWSGEQHVFQGFLATPVFQSDNAADLKARLTTLLPDEKVAWLYYRGVFLGSSEKLWRYLPDMHDKSPRFTVVTVKKDLVPPTLIHVRDLTGKLTPLEIYPTETVAALKECFHDQSGVPPDQQRLIYDGRQLEEDRRVCSYSVSQGCTIFVVLRLRGGGPAPPPQLFVDVTNSTAIQKLSFSSKAPEWRIATKGLNIEGRCRNARCRASGKMVVCKKGAGAFTLGTTPCVCPLCKSAVEPVTSAFHDCAWMYDGVKTGGEEVRSPWKIAGKQYERFQESGNMTSWDRLVLTVSLDTSVAPSAPPLFGTTVDSAAVAKECSICLDSIEAYGNSRPTKVSACGHTFHRECLDKWTSFSANCPLCRRDVVSGGY